MDAQGTAMGKAGGDIPYRLPELLIPIPIHLPHAYPSQAPLNPGDNRPINSLPPLL